VSVQTTRKRIVSILLWSFQPVAPWLFGGFTSAWACGKISSAKILLP
jgi:hypothetical protein